MNRTIYNVVTTILNEGVLENHVTAFKTLTAATACLTVLSKGYNRDSRFMGYENSPYYTVTRTERDGKTISIKAKSTGEPKMLIIEIIETPLF